MELYSYILYRLALFWGLMPPETTIAGLFATPGIFGLLAGLPWIVDLVAGGFVSWWLAEIFRTHVWPELTHEHQRLLLQARAWVLFVPTNQDHDDEPGQDGGRRG